MLRSCLASLVLLSSAYVSHAGAHGCSPSATIESIERSLSDITHAKLKFVGYPSPVVTRVPVIGGSEKKVMIKSYSHKPVITVVDGQLVMTAEGTCESSSGDGHDHDHDHDHESNSTTAPPQGQDAVDKAGTSGFSALLLAGTVALTTRGEAPALTACLGAAMMVMGAAGGSHECAPIIEVEIHIPMTEPMIDDSIMKMSHGGQYMTCPAETLQWTHQPTVYKGYSGCTGESGLTPCPTDGFEGMSGLTDLHKPYTFDEATGTCTSTDYTMHNTTLWILWGLPMDTKELNMRTGLNPVVKFPLLRGTYPSYAWGSHGDDAADLKVKFKDFLLYEEAFTSSELDKFDVEVSEGAEAGMVELYAAMALHIARTTCNRDIYVLAEGPCYGYSNSRAAEIVNSHASSFFNDASCTCFNASTCTDKTVTITTKGFVPGGPTPSAKGADNVTYSATSTSAHSPWFETMVFPENPSGVRKTPKLEAHRRICDGVYLFPMYFGGDDWKVPLSARPDCAAWSFSITKIYSAAVRAGTVIYKNDMPGFHGAVNDVMKKVHSIADGIYSEWSWMGQIQIYDMIMAKPYSDPTSWIGAYSLLMKDKWDYIIDGFKDCPVVEVTNPHQGAYVWFKYLGAYKGLQSSMTSSFFLDTLLVKTTTYYWGFRGANPADWYGEGYGVYDFTRLQLYRDVNVYAEVSRRAKIVCGGGSLPTGISIAAWNQTSMAAKGNRRLTSESTVEAHERVLQESAPSLSSKDVKNLAKKRHEAAVAHNNVEKFCAPEYSTSCLFEHVHQDELDF